MGEFSEILASVPEGREGSQRLGEQAVGLFAGFLHAEEAREGGFPLMEVFPRRLAQRLGGRRDIQKVVHHLEGHSQGGAVSFESLHGGSGRPSPNGASLQAGFEEDAGFQAVDAEKPRKVGG